MCDRSPDFERARTLQSRAWSGTELEAGAEYLAASSGLMRSINHLSRDELMQRLQERRSCESCVCVCVGGLCACHMCQGIAWISVWVLAGFCSQEAEAALKQMPKPDPEIKREMRESSLQI